MLSCLSFRIASLSKIFPTLMLYKLWEDGKIVSLDDPLEKYTVERYKFAPPLSPCAGWQASSQVFSAHDASGLPRRLRATNLLWKGKTQSAINLLQDDVLVADPGTK
ncbi:hypothetical protein AMECASPLE_038470 [Ameca splendens]|uniref:Beta-lactamase-related domain-containing protein n=1 Tax=Ameca splendens TaxID=208324 RepID=A0ABV0YVC6_9TELE